MSELLDRAILDHRLGLGNGNIGVVVLHTQEPGSGGLASTTRVFEHTYDHRDRLIATENPTAPHDAYAYDNLGRVTGSATFSSPTSSVGTATNRGWLEHRFYSQRGRLYRTAVAVDAADGSPDFLQSDVWYDAEGRTIKSHPHSSPAVKYVYDGLDRVTTEYLTDAKGDAKPGNSGSHASADDVSGDTVFEQTLYTYSDGDGLLDLVERRERSHDSSATGAIGGSDAVASWVGFYYDDADRRTHTVDFGTTEAVYETGGSAPSWPPGSPPSATSGTYDSDDYIVTETVFNVRGLVDRAIDPMGEVTKYLYDDAGRVIAVIEAYDDAALDSPRYASGRWQFVDLDDDRDRVTSYVYNGVDQVVWMAAHLPDGAGDKAQVTEYTYA